MRRYINFSCRMQRQVQETAWNFLNLLHRLPWWGVQLGTQNAKIRLEDNAKGGFKVHLQTELNQVSPSTPRRLTCADTFCDWPISWSSDRFASLLIQIIGTKDLLISQTNPFIEVVFEKNKMIMEKEENFHLFFSSGFIMSFRTSRLTHY